jgi:hypothetical protein
MTTKNTNAHTDAKTTAEEEKVEQEFLAKQAGEPDSPTEKAGEYRTSSTTTASVDEATFRNVKLTT